MITVDNAGSRSRERWRCWCTRRRCILVSMIRKKIIRLSIYAKLLYQFRICEKTITKLNSVEILKSYVAKQKIGLGTVAYYFSNINHSRHVLPCDRVRAQLQGRKQDGGAHSTSRRGKCHREAGDGWWGRGRWEEDNESDEAENWKCFWAETGEEWNNEKVGIRIFYAYSNWNFAIFSYNFKQRISEFTENSSSAKPVKLSQEELKMKCKCTRIDWRKCVAQCEEQEIEIER